MEKVGKQYDDLVKKVEHLKSKSKELEDDEQNRIDKTVVALEKMALKYASIGTVVQVVGNEITSLIEKQAQAAEKFGETNKLILQQLAAIQQISGSDRVSAFAEQAASAGVGSVQDTVSLLNKVQMQSPGMAAGRGEEIAKQLLPVLPLLDDSARTNVADLAGRLGDIAPGKSGQDVADLALRANAAAGVDASQLNSTAIRNGVRMLVDNGMSVEDAMGFAIASSNEDIGPKFAKRMFEVLSSDEKPTGNTAEDRWQRKMSTMTAPDRLALLQQNEEAGKAVLGAVGYSQFQRVGTERLGDLRSLLNGDAGGGAADLLNQARQTEVGRDVLDEYQRAARKSAVEFKRGGKHDPIADAYDEMELERDESGMHWTGKSLAKMSTTMGYYFESLFGAQEGGRERADSYLPADQRSVVGELSKVNATLETISRQRSAATAVHGETQ